MFSHVRYVQPVRHYSGPLRKGSQVASGSPYQLFAAILIDVCYKAYGVVAESSPCPASRPAGTIRRSISGRTCRERSTFLCSMNSPP
jgi:hypothetical protein